MSKTPGHAQSRPHKAQETHQRKCAAEKNRMDIEELLNPVSERELVTNTSEEEIFKSVEAACEAEEMVKINGGESGDSDDGSVDEKPTCKDALMAIFTLQKYVVYVTDINEPFARKLEGILQSFRRQTRLEATCTMELTYWLLQRKL